MFSACVCLCVWTVLSELSAEINRDLRSTEADRQPVNADTDKVKLCSASVCRCPEEDEGRNDLHPANMQHLIQIHNLSLTWRLGAVV